LSRKNKIIKKKRETKTPERHCCSCFFSTKFPGITVDKYGRCNLCNSRDFAASRKTLTYSDIAELRRIAKRLKQNRQGKYDCIIGASGGLDSSYVIYITARVLGLNPLVICYDAGFSYDIAKQNLKALCAALKVDLKIIRSASQNDSKYVRYTVLALSSINAYWGICLFCHYILRAVIYKYALNENIQAVMTSTNHYEDWDLPRGFRLRFMINALLKAGLWRLPKLVLYLTVARYYLLRLKLEFYVPPITNMFSRSPKRPPIEMVNVTKYVEWDILKMVNTLKKQTAWTTPEHPNLQMRFDCKIEDSFVNHTYKNATGMTIQGIICNNLIHDDIGTKSQLKEIVEYYDNIISHRMEEVRAHLGLKRN